MELRNWETAVYALYLEGGVSRSVHTEDVALRSFKLAPDIFSWVKHQEYPDKDIARVALTDARKEKMGQLVIGRAGRGKGQHAKTGSRRSVDGWRLTEAGVGWVIENEERLANELQERQPRAHRQELLQRLSRIRKHKLFRDYEDQPASFVPSLGLLAELLRCRVDAGRNVWSRRFVTLRNHARLAHQDDILAFLDICEAFIDSSSEAKK